MRESFTGTPDQCFLLAYRALCHEVYQKNAAVRSYPAMPDLVDRGMPHQVQRHIRAQFGAFEIGGTAGLRDLQAIKARADVALQERDYAEWASCVVYFRGAIAVASAGTLSPNVTLSGISLQTMHDVAASQEPLFVGTVPTPDGGAIVFSWLARHTAPRRFIESLLALPHSAVPSTIVQILFAYLSNTYFSPAWWVSLTTAQRGRIGELAAITNAYYQEIPYTNERLIGWEITEVRRS